MNAPARALLRRTIVVFAIGSRTVWQWHGTAAAVEPPRRVLQFVTSYKDELEGLTGATSLAMSRDGRHVYAAASFSKTLLLLHRDPNSGGLKLHRVYQDPYARPRLGGAVQLPVSHIPDLIAISPDDQHLYVVGVGVTVYSRDAATGEVTLVGVVNHKPLVHVVSLVFSPDGRNAYALGKVNGTLAIYARDPETGMLTLVEVVQDDEGFSNAKKAPGARAVSSLASPKAVCVSPDGRHVFVVASGGGALTVFARNTDTGRLRLAQTLRDSLEKDRIIPFDRGLLAVENVAISPDGRLVFTVSRRGRLSVFERDPAAGQLSHRTTFYDKVNVPELGDPTILYASPNLLLVACARDWTLAVFRRDPKWGNTLQFIETVGREQSGVDSRAGVRAFACDASGEHLYILSEGKVIAVSGIANPPMPNDSPEPDRPKLVP